MTTYHADYRITPTTTEVTLSRADAPPVKAWDVDYQLQPCNKTGERKTVIVKHPRPSLAS